MIAQAASIRAYALMLTAGKAEAEDLVQDTFEKAWRARDQFAQGSNMRAWLLTILRNTYYNGWRRSRRTMEDIDGARAAQLTVAATQGWRAEFSDVLRALERLDPDSKHALLLITAGLSYEEAANVCGCALRTVQSRVRRARERLVIILDEPPSARPATIDADNHLGVVGGSSVSNPSVRARVSRPPS